MILALSLESLTHPLAGEGYGFYSGFGSDFGEVVLLGIFLTMFKHFNCHVNSPRFCWRFGHPVPGTSFRACHKHHPDRDRKVTAEHVANGGKP